jgi:putative transposase
MRMAKKRFQAEQIIGKLREAEVEISKGQTISQIVKKLGITEQTYYRWRNGHRREAVVAAACGLTRPSDSKNWRRRTPG